MQDETSSEQTVRIRQAGALEQRRALDSSGTEDDEFALTLTGPGDTVFGLEPGFVGSTVPEAPTAHNPGANFSNSSRSTLQL